MKTIAIVFASALVLSACAADKTPNVPVTGREEVHQMSRQEIINATVECKEAGMRAQVITAERKINNRPTDIIIDVYCYPQNRTY